MAYKHQFLLGKKNLYIVLAGIGVIALGMLIMAGGATTDPLIYPEEEMYGFRRTVLAPFVILLGFAMQIYAILAKSEPLPDPKPKMTSTSSSKTGKKTTTSRSKRGKK